jgi:hypothetical protein
MYCFKVLVDYICQLPLASIIIVFNSSSSSSSNLKLAFFAVPPSKKLARIALANAPHAEGLVNPKYFYLIKIGKNLPKMDFSIFFEKSHFLVVISNTQFIYSNRDVYIAIALCSMQ